MTSGSRVSEGLPFAATVIAFVAGVALSPSEADLGFYEAAAQIIPVLLLVLAVELGFVRSSDLPTAMWLTSIISQETVRSPPRQIQGLARHLKQLRAEGRNTRILRALIGAATVLALALGEFFALHPLSEGRAEAGNPRLVYGALCAGICAIAMVSMMQARTHPPEEAD